MTAAFSLLLPEGGRVAVRRPSVIAAVVEARDTNASRAERGLRLCVLLHRPSGLTWGVAPTADAMGLANRIESEVLPSAPMAAPKNPRGGRPKRVPGEATKAYAVNLTRSERERYERLASTWGCSLGDAIRRAADEACEREGVPAVRS